MIEEVTFEQAHAFLAEHPEAVLLDVRDECEYITGHAENSVLLPLDDIDESSASFAVPGKDTPVLTYCRTGSRSREAAEKLDSLGYSCILNIGSLVGWPYGLVTY